MATWQHAIFIAVRGEHLPMSIAEAREVIAKLRQPDQSTPRLADARIAAAVFLERLADELGAHNPPLTRREARAIAMAINGLEWTEGITEQQRAVGDALLAWDMTSDSE